MYKVCMRDAHFTTKLTKTFFKVDVHENCCVIGVEK